MTRINRNLLVGVGAYGAFCVVNYYFSSGRMGVAPGQNALADFNDKLLPFNLLAKWLGQGTAAAAIPTMQVTPALPAPQITVQPSGTTTYFGP